MRPVFLACAAFGLSAGGSLPAAPAAAPSEQPLWPSGLPGALPAERITDREYAVPTLTPFLLTVAPGHPHPAVVVCPGGGYTHLSMDQEGFAVARWFNSLGISAVVLRYRLKDYGQPAPLQDVLQAMRTARAHAKEWGIDPHRLGIIGFSAGGHLAACAGTLYDAPEGRVAGSYDTVSGRPDFMILVYPVITMKEPWAHPGSRKSLLGTEPTPELVAHYSLEDQVTRQTPPAFLVHSSVDPVVPVENSVLFYSALHRAGVSAELHVYLAGPHGFGLSPNLGAISEWPLRAAEWLQAIGIVGPAH